jgi:hypothetical protein
VTEKKIGRIGLVVENQKPATEESVELIDTLIDMLTRARPANCSGWRWSKLSQTGNIRH